MVFIATSLTFALLKLSPGDPYSVFFESNISPAIIQNHKVARGFDRPVAEQYVRWISLAARGNFGYSVMLNQDVSASIRNTLPRTLWLMSLALLASIAGGMALGAWQGANSGKASEQAVYASVVLAYSTPAFWMAALLQFVFAYELGWFSVSSATVSTDHMLGQWHYVLSLVRNMFLPWLALTIPGTAVFARYQRVAMREVMGEIFVRSARAKGLRESAVVWQHAFRVAVVPVLTVAGLWFPTLVAGAVFVEQVFGWPGMGKLLVSAISNHDYDVVTGCVIIGSVMTAAGSLLADLAREAIDPRLRA